jgi:hypothetical protein
MVIRSWSFCSLDLGSPPSEENNSLTPPTLPKVYVSTMKLGIGRRVYYDLPGPSYAYYLSYQLRFCHLKLATEVL